ncbi:MAG: hypothetical protein K0Q72_613 [Armatimonadetes bacterium]|nr:hypothetical protein [Armatimonadota bacterium]
MKRAITGLLGALFVSGTLLTVAAPQAASADPFHRRRIETRRRDIDRDGIRNRRDRDRDGDGIRNRRDWDRDGDRIPNWRDRNDRRYNSGRRSTYYNGRYYPGNSYFGRRHGDLDGDGIPNPRDRDRDGDGVRDSRDKHPADPRRR